jgi:hypothetical protein
MEIKYMMKKIKISLSMLAVAALAICSFQKANACTGEWIAVYDGQSTPNHYVCDSSWIWSECICGDTKAAG